MAAPGVASQQEKRNAAPRQPQWYTADHHLQERRRMITNMCVNRVVRGVRQALRSVCGVRSARLLQARKPNAPADWMQKLPQMARRLEESLFRTAESFASCGVSASSVPRRV